MSEITNDMLLDQNILLLRKEILQLIEDNHISAAITLYRQQLLEESEQFNTLILIQRNYKQVKENLIKGLISSEEYLRQSANIANSLVAVVTQYFEELPLDSKEVINSLQVGTLAYQIPRHMPLKNPSICTIRVATDSSMIKEGIDNDDLRVREHVEISKRMSAELMDTNGNVFEIVPFSSKDQGIRQNGYTQWLFRVTPLKEGEHQLLVKVLLLEFDINTKEYIPRDISLIEKVLVVTTNDHTYLDEELNEGIAGTFILGPAQRSRINIWNTLWKNNIFKKPATILMLFLFISSVLYAVTPKVVRDWWVASFYNTPKAYQEFIDKYSKKPKTPIATSKIEKAYFLKAELGNSLGDFRNYLHIYGNHGIYSIQIQKKIKSIERKTIRSIRNNPSSANIQGYLKDFPDATYLNELVHVANKMPDSEQNKLMPLLEKAYKSYIIQEPTVQKLIFYSENFNDINFLNKIFNAISEKPDEFQHLKPILDTLIIKQRKKDTGNAQTKKTFDILNFTKKITQIETVKNETIDEEMMISGIGKHDVLIDVLPKIEPRKLQTELMIPTYLPKIESRELQTELIIPPHSPKIGTYDTLNTAVLKKEPKRKFIQALNEILDKIIPMGAARDKQKEAFKDPFQDLMVKVEGARFEMGSPNQDSLAEENEKPAYPVENLNDFYISKYEVTQAQWHEVMKKKSDNLGFIGCDSCAVAQVSYTDVQLFLKKLNEKTNKNYRLPTEEEWEFAARGGVKSKGFIYAGSDTLNNVGWFDGNSKSMVQKVGQKKPNELGIYDMSGNVYEWCSDNFVYYPRNEKVKYNKGSKQNYVNRGGAWSESIDKCRNKSRNYYTQNSRGPHLGLRLALW